MSYLVWEVGVAFTALLQLRDICGSIVSAHCCDHIVECFTVLNMYVFIQCSVWFAEIVAIGLGRLTQWN